MLPATIGVQTTAELSQMNTSAALDRLAVAVQHHQAGRLQEAEAIYWEILAGAPEHFDAMHMLGVLAIQVGQHGLAADLIAKAIQLSPKPSPFFYSDLGIAQAGAGCQREAEASFRHALAIDPGTHPAATQLCKLLESQGRQEEAQQLLSRTAIANVKADKLRVYQADIEKARKTKYMDFPAHVHLETLAQCDAACVFCPYPELERQGERMTDALIEKVISDLEEIPRNLPFQLSPFKVNEPFLDVRLFDVLGSINQRLPNATINLTTNGSAATVKNIDRVAAVKNLHYLWISFNDHREVEYEATMKLPFRRTIERLRMIHERKRAGDFPIRVVLSRVGDGTAADDEFCRWAKYAFPLFETSVFQRGAWIGQVKDVDQDVPNVGCARWFDLSITATGIVAHCCMDGQAKYPIGDVRKDHVLTIYNSPHYRQLREKTLTRMSASPCNRCAFL